MTADMPKKDRSGWPVRVYRLGSEPPADLSATTTAEERLEMVWALTLEADGEAAARLSEVRGPGPGAPAHRSRRVNEDFGEV